MLAQAAKGESGAAWLLLTAADFSFSFFNSRFSPSLCVAIVMGCRFILFHRFKKRAHFKFWINQKAAVQFFSIDFNFLIFSRFNFKILILQFDLLKSKINQKSDDNQPISGFISQFPEDST
jgi:hypothetical protein